MARRLADGWKVSVEALNAGAQGYDTVAEAAFLDGPGAALAPDGVVVGMSLNDYDPAPAYDPTGVLRRKVDARLRSARSHSRSSCCSCAGSARGRAGT